MLFFATMTFGVAVPRHIAVRRTEAKAGPTSSIVSYGSGDETARSYLTLPEGGTPPHPAVVVVHDWQGTNDAIQASARRLALSDDFVVLAVNLYHGNVPSAVESALTEGAVLRDLSSAVEYLKARRDVDPTRIAVVGWGMGADYALTFALEQTDLRAVVLCGARQVRLNASYERLQARLLALYGGRGSDVPVERVRQFEQTLRNLGKDAQVAIYPKAAPVFEDAGSPNVPRQSGTANVWLQIDDFLTSALAPIPLRRQNALPNDDDAR